MPIKMVSHQHAANLPLSGSRGCSVIFFEHRQLMNRYLSNNNWVYLLNTPPASVPNFQDASAGLSQSKTGFWPDRPESGSLLNQGLALAVQAPLTRHMGHLRTPTFDEEPIELQRYGDHLIKELHVLGHHFHRASVPYLHWFGELATLFSSATLTRLMFTVARQFKLRNAYQRNVIELDTEPTQVETLGLLTGLEFNTVCINHHPENPRGFKLATLAKWIDLARDYGFQHVYLSISLPLQLTAQSLQAVEAVLSRHPDGILFVDRPSIEATNDRPRKTRSNPFSSCLSVDDYRGLLSAYHYRAASNCYFVRSDHPLYDGPKSLAGVGLGAFSFTPRSAALNTERLADYYDCTSRGEFPIGHSQSIIVPA
ncbi:MAG: hypothetical protein IPM37_21715 [Hahellaceae bacterium]|nr:hypothetical protein [Hahellaceae bacterium]